MGQTGQTDAFWIPHPTPHLCEFKQKITDIFSPFEHFFGMVLNFELTVTALITEKKTKNNVASVASMSTSILCL